MIPADQIPLVLSGPIVRRVEDGRASVWVALRQSATVELTVYEGAAGGPPVMTGSRRTVQVAANLHVAVVSATPLGDPLRWGATYSYDLHISTQTTPGTRSALSDPGVLGFAATASERLAPIVFPGQSLPSFALPASQRRELRLAHGSCRKPHGGGNDALGLLAQLIRDAALAGTPRPQQLFLTGDQIYVDDVAAALAPELLALADWLAGGTDGERHDLIEHHGATALAPGGRAAFVKTEAGFTSGEAANHLVTYLEICAMYLLAWSDALWSPALRDAPTLAGYAAQLGTVRRTLANVATYMIFDDHDVTDDWNRTGAWVDQVGRSAYGTRIIRNALAAYALFQHWGNDPDGFERGAGARFLADVDGWDGRAGAPDPGTDPAATFGWGFTLVGPAHVVVALDCRTQRQFGSPVAPPGLMTAAALERAFAGAPADQRPTVVISPTPLLGLGLITWMQSRLAQLMGGDKLDVEAWEHDRQAFDRAIEQLARRRRVVVLSGDVHYGFGASFVGREDPHTGCRIVNFTSSALLNNVFGARGAIGLNLGADANLERVSRAPGDPDVEGVAIDAVIDAKELEAAAVGSPRVRAVGGFKEEILDETGALEESVPRSEGGAEREAVTGSRRRAPVVGHANVGEIKFEENHVVQVLWAWNDGDDGRFHVEHRASLPAD